jgi:hypothetical protein
MPLSTGDIVLGVILEITAGEELTVNVNELSATPFTVTVRVTEVVPDVNLLVWHFNSVAVVDSIRHFEPSLKVRDTLVPSFVL